MKNNFILLSICLLLNACASSGGKPAWINGVAKDYPQNQYLTAVGTASNVEVAKSAALANLAKIFEVKVNETSRDEAAAWRSSGDDGKSVQGGSQITVRYVDAFTTKLLEGATIAQIWQDEKSGQYFALAVASRSQLTNRLSTQIRKADQYAQRLLAQAKQQREPFRAAQALHRAQKALVSRELLQKDLQIVDISGRGIQPRWTTSDLELQINSILGRLAAATEVLLDPVGDLEPALPAAVTAIGMQYREQARYQLQASLDVEDLGWRDNWYWYRGALEVQLLNVDSDEVLANHRWALKSSGQSQEQARIRLQDQVANRLHTQLKGVLLSFAQKADEK